MHTTEAPSSPGRSEGGFRYAATTFFLVGALSTLTQMIAVASLGLPLRLEWSSGGLIALVAGIWTWIQCRSWAAWRKWVWIPAVITIVAAFVSINLMVASANQEAERKAAEEHAAMCYLVEVELASKTKALDDLLAKAWAYEGVWKAEARRDDWRPRPDDGTGMTEWAKVGGGFPSRAEVWAFYVSYGGPDLETKIAEYQAAYAAECGPD